MFHLEGFQIDGEQQKYLIEIIILFLLMSYLHMNGMNQNNILLVCIIVGCVFCYFNNNSTIFFQKLFQLYRNVFHYIFKKWSVKRSPTECI